MHVCVEEEEDLGTESLTHNGNSGCNSGLQSFLVSQQHFNEGRELLLNYVALLLSVGCKATT